MSGGDAADALDELGAAHLLEDIARGSGHDRIEQCLVVRERREHQAPYVRQHRPQVAAHLDPGAVGKSDVEHGHVGRCGDRSSDGVGGGGGLGDHLDIFGVLEQLADPSSDHLVIVQEEHPDHDRPHGTRGAATVIGADATGTAP